MSYLDRPKSERSHSFLKTKIKEHGQKSLYIIGRKRAKVLEHSSVEKQKVDLYCKLANKLERQLKVIKSHNTPEARQKLILLEKCRNQKHIRRKTRKLELSQNRPNDFIESNPLSRPKTSCPTTSKYSMHKPLRSKEGSKENSFEYANFRTYHSKLDEIKLKCVREESRSHEIKQDINTIYFYQNLVCKNSSKIFTKML